MGSFALTRERRKHIRLEHKSAVEFVSGNQTIEGTITNISRNGMQVVVNLPLSHDSIRSIAFQVPVPGAKIPIPCRLVRSSGSDRSGELVLGIEFEYEAEAQLLLIEKFIEDSASREAESRQLPRAACRLQNVQIDRDGVEVLSIDNLSTEGGLISFRGTLHAGEAVVLKLVLQGDSGRLQLVGEVVYVLEKKFDGEFSAGIRFHGLCKNEESRLKNLIIACCSGSALSKVHQVFRSRVHSSEQRIGGAIAISRLLQNLHKEQLPLSLLVEGSLHIREARICAIRSQDGLFTVILSDNNGMPAAGAVTSPAFFAFVHSGSSHYFKTAVTAVDANSLHLHLPETIFRSDKRSYKRKSLEISAEVQLTGSQSLGQDMVFTGVLLDISRRGFLCEIPLSPEVEEVLKCGRSVSYMIDERLGLGKEGQVRHVRRIGSPKGHALQVGIEAGIARMDYRLTVVPPDRWPEEKAPPARQAAWGVNRIESLPVCFQDKAGYVIRGLLNITHPGAQCPVVIVPPSYGKKKEAFAPLVATLLSNAWAQQKPLAILRFDGVNRPGESHNDVPNPRLGYEMLSYRISQGLADMQAALDYVRRSEHFAAGRTILITFSMSTIDARRLLSQVPDHGVDFWINCMGVPCAQTTLRNVLAGIDVVNNARMGVSNGLMGMLGHLINMDILARDVLDRKYAFLTDARLDMARISIPVLWISGNHDKWVDQEEVRDLMSVKAEGSRELLEIPSGHNLRTSDDAIQTFRLMAAAIHHQLDGQPVEPCDPDKAEMLRLITAERERLENRATLPTMPDYWRGYLIGNERNRVGYDFYRNIEEFAEFLRAEAELLEIEDGERIADLGCGTGLLLEVLLQNLARRSVPLESCKIQAFDLVPEALAKAEIKCRALQSTESSLRGVEVSFLEAALEPNRLQPVARFLQSPDGDLEILRHRISGLTSAILDRLSQIDSAELHAILRGSSPQEPLPGPLVSELHEEELAAVLDLSLAARFLQNRLRPEDLMQPPSHGRIESRSLRTGALRFQLLDFGDSGNQLSPAFNRNRYTKIMASLFISYLQNPEYLLEECFQAMEPGGQLLVSSMKPDSDISVIFVNYIQALQRAEWNLAHETDREQILSGARAMLNEAASLFELEESGYFRFYNAQELSDLLSDAGFCKVSVRPAMGTPPQALIAWGFKA